MSKNRNKLIITKQLYLHPSDEDRDLHIYHKHLREDGDFELFCGLKLTEENVALLRLSYQLFFSIYLKDSDTMIGYVGIEKENIEFYIFKPYRRKGYAKEAITMLLQSAFKQELLDCDGNVLTFQTIGASTIADNEPAKKLLECCGFKQEPAASWEILYDAEREQMLTLSVVVYSIETSLKN